MMIDIDDGINELFIWIVDRYDFCMFDIFIYYLVKRKMIDYICVFLYIILKFICI